MRLLLTIILLAGWARGQSGIEVPAVGAIVDSTGALRPVQGVVGSFLLGPARMSGVLSTACSEQLCLVKTDSTILSPTGETDAPAGPAIFALRGDDAIVFFPVSRRFARWHDDALDPLDWVVDGEVLSILLNGREPEIAVRKNGEVSIVDPNGSVIDSIPGASGPVLLLPEGVVFATKDEIVLRRDDSEVRFELADARSIIAMGPRYAAIQTGDATYALRTESGREGLYRLPGSAP